MLGWPYLGPIVLWQEGPSRHKVTSLSQSHALEEVWTLQKALIFFYVPIISMSPSVWGTLSLYFTGHNMLVADRGLANVMLPRWTLHLTWDNRKLFRTIKDNPCCSRESCILYSWWWLSGSRQVMQGQARALYCGTLIPWNGKKLNWLFFLYNTWY